MARITVEDCEKVVENRFDLVVLAAQRTRQILAGDNITVDSKEEKRPVISLREIAARTVSTEALKESAIKSFRSFTTTDDLNEEVNELIEEDTYNPYAGIEMKSLEETDRVSVVSDVALEDDSAFTEEFVSK
jgi:DNA-directed RNA polymerase subunit omega